MDVREFLLKKSQETEGDEREDYIDFLRRLFDSVDNFYKTGASAERYAKLTPENREKVDRMIDILYST